MKHDVISDEYRKQNRLLHEEREKLFGGTGRKWSDAVAGLILIANSRHFKDRFVIKTVLDYGCGPNHLVKHTKKRTDEMGMDIVYSGYDPCVKGRDAAPNPADFVICTDVLEHIEPKLLDNVLEHIDSLMGKLALLVVSLQESGDILPDGRNAHQIVETHEWWMRRLERMNGWHVICIPARKPSRVFTALVLKKEYTEWLNSLQNSTGKPATNST